MADTHTPTAPSSSSFSSNANLPMFYYGLVVVGTAAVVLALYNLIIIRWCAQRQDESRLRHAELAEVTARRRLENPNGNLLSSFKYKKESNNKNSMVWQDQDIDPSGGYECAVCLSVFEDGEEVRQLPRCKHSFHAPCIDMWLNSHFDCPLCRATINPSPLCHQGTVANSLQNSGQGLPDVEIQV